MAHPYVELLRDRHVRILWVGLALSALGGELYRAGQGPEEPFEKATVAVAAARALPR